MSILNLTIGKYYKSSNNHVYVELLTIFYVSTSGFSCPSVPRKIVSRSEPIKRIPDYIYVSWLLCSGKSKKVLNSTWNNYLNV